MEGQRTARLLERMDEDHDEHKTILRISPQDAAAQGSPCVPCGILAATGDPGNTGADLYRALQL
jgi:hypothetical protein